MTKLLYAFTILLTILASGCAETTPKYDVPIIISIEDVQRTIYHQDNQFAYLVNVRNTGTDELRVQLHVRPKGGGEKITCLQSILDFSMGPGEDMSVLAEACGLIGPPEVTELVTNLREVDVNGTRIGIKELNLSTAKVENSYPGITVLEPGWNGLGPMIERTSEPVSDKQREKMRRQIMCSETKSKMTVQKMCKELNYMVTDIRLVEEKNCRYQWLIQGVETEYNTSFNCLVNTDGSGGEMEIANVDCD
jgi:hypothetical protein